MDPSPDDPDLVYERARQLLRLGDREAADGTVHHGYLLSLDCGTVEFVGSVEAPGEKTARAVAALRSCLDDDPGHGEAKALLGMILVRTPETLAEGARLLVAAEAIGVDTAEVHFGLGQVALIQGLCELARASFAKARDRDPACVDATILMAMADTALKPNPDWHPLLCQADEHCLMSILAVLTSALRFPDLAVEIRAAFGDLARGVTIGLAQEAVGCLKDNAPDAMRRAGRLLHFTTQLEIPLPEVELAAGLVAFIKSDFNMAAVACNNVLAQTGRGEFAAEMLELSLLAQGKDPVLPEHREKLPARAFRRLAEAHCRTWRFGDAERALRQAIERDPSDFDAIIELADALAYAGDTVGAIEWGERALSLAPDRASIQVRLGKFHLAVGNLDQAWPLLEARVVLARADSPRPLPPLPPWQGEAAPEKTLLVSREEGVGDEIRFASCLPDAQSGFEGRVVCDCDHRLEALFQRSFPGIDVRAEQPGPHDVTGLDCFAPMMSLPQFFRRRLEDFPEHGGFLVADPDRVAIWRNRLAAFGDGPKIGFAWKSLNTSWRKRPMQPLITDWRPVLALPGVQFINLQISDVADDIAWAEAECRARFRVFDDIDLRNDIDEVAALIVALDAVAASRSWIPILAGALGVPAYSFSAPLDPNVLGQPRDPWAPTTRLFHRQANEDWNGPMTALAGELRLL